MAWHRVLVMFALSIELLGVFALAGWVMPDCPEGSRAKTLALIALVMLLSVVFTAISCSNSNARSPPPPPPLVVQVMPLEEEEEKETSELGSLTILKGTSSPFFLVIFYQY